MTSEREPPAVTVEGVADDIDYRKISAAIENLSPFGLNPDERKFFDETMLESFRSKAEAVRKEKGDLDEFSKRYERRRRLCDFADPKPEDENPDALFRNGWLRRGGGAFFVSTSGAGKSVAQTQFCYCWALGRPWFEIAPVRPLSISVYQAEDDADEVGDFRNNIRRGLTSREDWTDEDTAKAEERIVYHDVTGLTGERFTQFVAEAQRRDKSDLLVLNPLQSFAGCDIGKNDLMSEFLRGRIDPILRNPDAPCGVLIIHHTNKVTQNARERALVKGTDAAAYAGAGAAELVNWARAVLTLRPHEAHGFFDLIAAKRGDRLGWKDANGKPTIVKTIAHSTPLLFWHEATAEEIAAAKSGVVTEETLKRKKLVEICRLNGRGFSTKRELIDAAIDAGIGGRNIVLRLMDECIRRGELRKGEPVGRATPIGTPEQLPTHTPNLPEC